MANRQQADLESGQTLICKGKRAQWRKQVKSEAWNSSLANGD